MLQLDEILEMWKKDSRIDENNLDEASLNSAKLHSKYLEILSIYKLQLKKREADFKVLLKNKWLWYNGKMSKDQIDELGWEYDALNGLKVLKGEMDYYYDSDPHIQEAQAKIEYLKTMIDTLSDIMENIKWRHQNIRNAIEWRKFTSGV
jgi:hypothetical protein